ncbi:MAG: hypothetical protein ACREXR_11515 [Gammaproteobacteria bacterium]
MKKHKQKTCAFILRDAKFKKQEKFTIFFYPSGEPKADKEKYLISNRNQKQSKSVSEKSDFCAESASRR